MRLQRLVLLVTDEWFGKRWKAFNYRFSRCRGGPLAKDFYQTECDLAQAGLVD